MDTLQISFFGPFLYAFKASRIEVYVPKCPGHISGIFTAKKEGPLTGQYRHGNSRCYELGGPVFTPPNPVPFPNIYDPYNTILDASKVANPALDPAHFCLVVPLPQTVCPTNPAKVQLVDETTVPPAITWQDRATGLRFYYNADLSKTMTVTCNGFSDPYDFLAPKLKLDFDDVTIRCASTTAEDSDHEDAVGCFDAIAGLCGANWWISYDNPSGGQSSATLVRAGNDCRAPIVMIK
jgi:hypothetical protein